MSAPSIPLISPRTHLKLPFTRSPGSAQLEARKQQVKACSLFHLEPSSFLFPARHLFQRYCIKCCRNEELLLRHHAVCNLSAARRQRTLHSNRCRYEGGGTFDSLPAAAVLRRAKLQEKKRFSRREAFINQEISARISANET